MEQHNIDKIDMLIKQWGVPMQLVIAMEESAELSVICSKLIRGTVSRENVVGALGDAYVMLQTLCMVLDVSPEELERIATDKLERAISKIPLEGEAAVSEPTIKDGE